MALPDPRYVYSPSLQEYFVDKQTGLPLAGGKVYFYSDINRTQLKPVYKISGSPPNYSFVQLANPLTLTAVGTFDDGLGNDIIPYLYPYDIDGNVELYYVAVYDSSTLPPGTPQFTREAWPPFTLEDNGPTDTQITNYVPNGQFLIHYDIPATSTTAAGVIPSGQNVTILGPGGWTFEKPNAFTSVDSVTFTRYDAFVENPTASPRYACTVTNLVANAGEAYKFLAVKFDDVNKFASPEDEPQMYTFSFTGYVVGVQVSPEITIIKNFGTGGTPSSTVITPISPVTLTAQPQIFNVSFSFGSNESYALGTNNDDYVQVALNFPRNTTFTALITDAALFQGEIEITSFPQETNADMVTRSIAGWTDLPNPDGSTLYLPLIQTKYGLTWDDSSIGNIVLSASINPRNNQLFCDGAMYDTLGYSDLGIPYSRLQQVLYYPSLLGPLYGTGGDYATMYSLGVDVARFTTNKEGPETIAADSGGATSTGFTFYATAPSSPSGILHTGQVDLGVTAAISESVLITVFAKEIGMVTNSAVDVDTGFTITEVYNSSNLAQQFTISVGAVSPTTLGGKYFTYSALVAAVEEDFYVWFTYAGAGADPAPGGTGIQINIPFNLSAAHLSNAIISAMNGQQEQYIGFIAGSAITGGDWWSFYAAGVQTVVWYKVGSSGVQPNVPGAIYVQCSISSASTATQVCSITCSSINSRFFAVPNLNDQFIRIWGPDVIHDSLRVNLLIQNENIATLPGSYQNFAVQEHKHTGTFTSPSTFVESGTSSQVPKYTGFPSTGNFPYDVPITYTGINETRPENFYLAAYIIY